MSDLLKSLLLLLHLNQAAFVFIPTSSVSYSLENLLLLSSDDNWLQESYYCCFNVSDTVSVNLKIWDQK